MIIDHNEIYRLIAADSVPSRKLIGAAFGLKFTIISNAICWDLLAR